ncbi:MAG: aldo/keto reductase family protein [Lachnospiraceae bacterium]|jgi:aryl-alcohol dehydrogenase-like predicted oxidoreductase|nr:aldo/keto reductase family protein [Lachnospiraceae bacterium]
MQYRRLGNAGIKVSEISLGSYFGYGSVVDKQVAFDTIHRAYDLGVNFFDSADCYDDHAAEKVLGEALSGYDRGSYVLATKVFYPMGEGPNDRGLSRKHITESIDRSLRALGTDYVDIYYCHRYDTEAPLDETLRALDDLVRRGKVLYVGISEWAPGQIEEALGLADKLLLDRLVVDQLQYSLLNRAIEEKGGVLEVARKHRLGLVAFQPLAQGFLTGKYKSLSDFPQGSRMTKSEINKHIKRYFNQETLDRVNTLPAMAAELGITPAHLALAWVLRKDAVASALVGASRPAQIEENVKASGVSLPGDVLAKLDDVFTETV